MTAEGGGGVVTGLVAGLLISTILEYITEYISLYIAIFSGYILISVYNTLVAKKWY